MFIVALSETYFLLSILIPQDFLKQESLRLQEPLNF